MYCRQLLTGKKKCVEKKRYGAAALLLIFFFMNWFIHFFLVVHMNPTVLQKCSSLLIWAGLNDYFNYRLICCFFSMICLIYTMSKNCVLWNCDEQFSQSDIFRLLFVAFVQPTVQNPTFLYYKWQRKAKILTFKKKKWECLVENND